MHLHVPRSVPDDADLAGVPDPPRVYGGHPSPLASAVNRALAKRMLRAGKTCASVAETIGYHGASAFSDAFKAAFGVRPSVYAKQQHAPAAKRRPGKRTLVRRKPPDRRKAKALPRYDAKKPKPKKLKRLKKRGRKRPVA